MAPLPTPSWPNIGRVQKLTDMFEEKAKAEEPKVCEKQPTVHTMKTERVLRMHAALGEVQRETPMPTPEVVSAPSTPATQSPLNAVIQEVQPDDSASHIGDGDFSKMSNTEEEVEGSPSQ